MTLRATFMISAITLLIAGDCAIAFNLIGSEVDTQGVLREPFALIPIGFVALVIGVSSGLAALICLCVRTIKSCLYQN